MKVQELQKGLEFNGSHHLALCANDVDSLVKKNTEALLDASKNVSRDEHKET
jgi:hypothetical protein